MKIELVFIPSPGIGHIRSTAAIAKLLVDSDDRLSITLIVIPSQFSGNVSSSSIADVYPESEGRIRYSFLPTSDKLSHEQNQTYFSYMESQKLHVKNAVSKLVDEVLSPLAGIVVDMFCTPMIDVADEFGLPAYTYFTSSATYLGLYLHVHYIHDEDNFDVTELVGSNVELEVPTLSRRLPANCLPTVMLDKKGFLNFLHRVSSVRRTKGILVNSVAEMEPQALSFFAGETKNTPPVYAVGPVLDLKTDYHESRDEKKKEILQWLDEKPPRSVLFLCFGSEGGFIEEQAREIAIALEQSGYRFLWSLRHASPEMVMSGTPPGDFTNLREVLPEGFLDRTVGIGKIISWAPQVAILESPAIGGFVTHCGWNSILESLWFGIPTAAWPIYAEQQFNAFQMVEELGLAVEIRKDYRRDSLLGEPEIVTAEEIGRGIKCVMVEDSEIRKKVKKMSDKLHVALLNGGSSNAAMRMFVQDVIQNIPHK